MEWLIDQLLRPPTQTIIDLFDDMYGLLCDMVPWVPTAKANGMTAHYGGADALIKMLDVAQTARLKHVWWVGTAESVEARTEKHHVNQAKKYLDVSATLVSAVEKCNSVKAGNLDDAFPSTLADYMKVEIDACYVSYVTRLVAVVNTDATTPTMRAMQHGAEGGRWCDGLSDACTVEALQDRFKAQFQKGFVPSIFEAKLAERWAAFDGLANLEKQNPRAWLNKHNEDVASAKAVMSNMTRTFVEYEIAYGIVSGVTANQMGFKQFVQKRVKMIALRDVADELHPKYRFIIGKTMKNKSIYKD
jgi:hypothetical protein